MTRRQGHIAVSPVFLDRSLPISRLLFVHLKRRKDFLRMVNLSKPDGGSFGNMPSKKVGPAESMTVEVLALRVQSSSRKEEAIGE